MRDADLARAHSSHQITRSKRDAVDAPEIVSTVSDSPCSFEPNKASVVMSEVQDGIQYRAAREILGNIVRGSAGLIALSGYRRMNRHAAPVRISVNPRRRETQPNNAWIIDHMGAEFDTQTG